jgi:phosphoribosylaminoimidazolecarboxamide formyltransferase/IMP cyclohydrolase
LIFKSNLERPAGASPRSGVMTEQPIRRALVSVHDKTGLEQLAAALNRRGALILSTGGTARALRGLAVNVVDIASVTGAPEILDGRVKTLHPAIHAGILARRDKEDHLLTLQREQIGLIDLVVVNLYPFEATVAAGADFDATVEMIDIGGPAMARAAAKNHASVTVITTPDDYPALIAEMDRHAGATTLAFRRAMAAKAFAHTAAYDASIAAWLPEGADEALPERVVLAGWRRLVTRYGENPHQRGAFYATADAGLAQARQVQGKELSYNNIADADAALELVLEFDRPAVAIVKHANPCGVAQGDDLASAYAMAFACDPISAFGGIVASNRPLDGQAAAQITQIFTEVVVAPDADAAALEAFEAKPNLRLLLTGPLPQADEPGLTFRSVRGGFLLQERDAVTWPQDEPRVVTARAPDEREQADLRFAWAVAKHVKSNAIVFARGEATVAIGAGQMSRLDAVRIALQKGLEAGAAAGETGSRIAGSVMASDAFFPFADGLEAALAGGAVAVVQPGGSARDQEVIEAANRHGAAMLFTGERHFRH